MRRYRRILIAYGAISASSLISDSRISLLPKGITCSSELSGISLPKSDLTLVSRCQATLDLYVYMSSESISIIDGEKVFV